MKEEDQTYLEQLIKKQVLPPDAVEFNEHHYKLYSDEVEWGRAKNKCKLREGNLVVIDSIQENAFIYNLVKKQKHTWIGLQRIQRKWQWITLKGSNFRNWARDEPDMDLSAKNSQIGVGINACINGEIYEEDSPISKEYNGKWDDRFSNDNQVTGYVCEWDF